MKADSETRPSGSARTPPAQACLDPLLNALGWTGTARDLSDALPEGGVVPDVKTLIAVLENLNFRATPYEKPPRGISDQMLPGLLAGDDGDVWVLVERDETGRYKVFQGRKKRLATVNAEDLNGQIYLVQNDQQETSDFRNRLSWLTPLLKGERRFLGLLSVLSLLINCLSLAIPVYVLVAFDIAAASRMTIPLTLLSAGTALVVIGEMLLRDLRARSLAGFAARLHGRVMATAFERILALPVQVGEKASAACLKNRLRSFEAIRSIFASPLPSGLLDLPSAVLLVVAAFAVGGWLGWLVVIAASVLAGLSTLGIVRMRMKSSPADFGNAQIFTFRNEMVATLPVIRNSDAEEIWERRYGALMWLRLASEAGIRRVAASAAMMAQATAVLTALLILGFTANDVIRGELSVGALMALLVIVWRLAALFRPILLHTGDLVLALHLAGQFREFSRFPRETSRTSALPHSEISGRIELANVTCRTNEGLPVLRKITMTADSGELVAVAGSPGAGQGTLMRLLANLHMPDNGDVRIDGIDIRQHDPRRLRQRIALVSADQRLFTGSAAYNFTLVNPFADADRINAAIRDADLEAFFDGPEEGTETDLTDRLRAGLSSVVLSKLRLARAYVQDPAIYLFDEPLQDLDPSGRRALLNKLAGLKGMKTVVAATSDDDILNIADKVFVMKAGEIVKVVTQPPDYEDHAAKSLRSLLQDQQTTTVKEERPGWDRLNAPRKLSR